MKRTLYFLLASLLMLTPATMSGQTTPPVYHDGDVIELAGLTYQILSVADGTCQLGGLVNGQRLQAVATTDNDFLQVPTSIYPDGVTQFRIVAIADGACYGHTEFFYIDLSEGIETIGEEAFCGCSALRYFYLPSTLKSIGDHAFYGCSQLGYIQSYIEELFPLGDVFETSVYEKALLEVSYGFATKYHATAGWSQFNHFTERLNPVIAEGLYSGYYYIRNVATGLYVTCGGKYDMQIYTDDRGYDVLVENTSDGEHCHLLTEIYGSDGEGAIGQGGYMDATTLTDMVITRVAEGKYTITSVNGHLMATNDDTRQVSFIETTADDPHAQWEFVTYSDYHDEAMAKLSAATPDNPVDATVLIENANLTNGRDRRFGEWLYDFDFETVSASCTSPTSDSGGLFEVFRSQETKSSAPFQFFQGIYPLPGKYKLEVQGFYRDGSYALATNRRKNDKEEIMAYLFGGHDRIPLKSIFDEAKEEKEKGYSQKTIHGWIPNTMADAGYCFQGGAYNNELYFTVPEDYFGDNCIYIGIVGDQTIIYNNWTAFDNFRLTYYGPDAPDGIANVRSTEASTACYTLDGKRVSKPTKGVNIVRRSDGTVRKVFVK